MKHDVDCINRETECNDRRCLELSRNRWKQSTNNSKNINEYPEIFDNNNIKPQNNIYTKVKMSNQTDNTTYIEKLINGYDEKITLPTNWNDLTENKKFEYLSEFTHKHFSKVPKSLIPVIVGNFYNNPNEEMFDEIPEWLDREKFARGQRFACDHIFGIFFAQTLSLFILFSFEDGLKPLIFTGKSSEPYTAFSRYLSTASRVRNWLTSDPWTKGTAAYKDIRVVRKMHQNVRDKLSQLTRKEIDEAARIDNTWSPTRDVLIEDFKLICPVAGPTQCPYAFNKFHDVRPRHLNPGEMASTQFGFFGLVILFPEAFGIHSATDDDLEAYCHVWKGLGYLLGIEDKFNFCEGTFDEVKQRSRDFINSWLKPNLHDLTPECEHMMRCVTAGTQYYFPGAPYESSLLYLLELIDLDMPKFKTSMSYNAKMRYNMIKFVMKYPYRLSGVRNYLNKRVNSAVDRALKFDEEKHIELRAKSVKKMSEVLNNKIIKNDKIGDDKSSINATKYLQYKIMGVLMVITQCLILWGVTPMSGLI